MKLFSWLSETSVEGNPPIDILSPVEYMRQSEIFAKMCEKENEKTRSAIQEIVSTMKAADHMRIICKIMKNHVGAKYICISYGPPGLELEVCHEIGSSFRKVAWFVSMETILGNRTIIVSSHPICYFNGNRLIENAIYDKFPYKKYSNPDSETTIVKFGNRGLSDEDVEYLMKIANYVRVSLEDLIVDVNQICYSK